MFSMSLKPPPSLDDMVALPPFIDPDAPKGKEEKAMRERSMARTKSLAAMPGKDTSVFQSKGWDALFQAAQDVSGLKALVEEEEAAAAAAEGVAAGFSEVSHETPWRNNTKSTAAANKANKVKRPRGMEELYLLLDETPEETAEREKRLRERRETLLALRDEERKKWMSKHGRVCGNEGVLTNV
jgi:hypothetical protein